MNEICLILPILIPAAGGAAVYALRHISRTARNIITETVMVINAVVTWLLVLSRPNGELYLFSFTPDYSVKLSLDGLGAFFAAMTSTLAVFVTIYAFSYMKNEEHHHMFFTFFILTFAATGGISVSGNLITMYFFYEMMTLVTIPLVFHGCKKADMHAGRIYAAYQFGGAAFAFVGIVALTKIAGAGDFVLGGGLAASLSDTMVLNIIYLFMFFGFGVKACVFPFHGWLPMASVAPTPVTALLHAVAVVKAGVFAIMRVTYYSFGTSLLDEMWASKTAMAACAFTAVFAAAAAIRERHFKRRLAYSTVSNLSYILIGVMLLSEAGYAAALCHMIFHALIKMNAFLCSGAFMKQTGKKYITELDGVGYRMPVTFACYTVSALALTGIPLFCGFVSKWQLVTACTEREDVMSVIGAVALVVSAMLCAIYMITCAVRAFLHTPYEESVHDPDGGMLIPICIFSVLCIVFGVYASPIVDICVGIASGLI